MLSTKIDIKNYLRLLLSQVQCKKRENVLKIPKNIIRIIHFEIDTPPFKYISKEITTRWLPP